MPACVCVCMCVCMPRRGGLVQIGSLLAAPQTIRTFGGFAVAALETMLIKRFKVPLLTIRKLMAVCAQVPEALFAVLYGTASSPRAASLFYAGFVASGLLNYSGAWANEIEIHGQDAAMIGGAFVARVTLQPANHLSSLSQRSLP
eukprot:SAG22_NODE_2948_length_2083_cov_17.390121_2_plen_145_part_00